MELSTAGRRSICLPTRSQADYGAKVKDRPAFRIYLDEMIATYPEIFPANIGDGYWLYGGVMSKKLDLLTRRIKLKASGDVYQLRSDFVMPYMSLVLADFVESTPNLSSQLSSIDLEFMLS